MYIFESYYPLLPEADRRRLAYAIAIVYHSHIRGEIVASRMEFLGIASLYRIVQDHDMFRLEALGATNTAYNPF